MQFDALGCVTWPLGFVASGVAAGVKKNGFKDIALVASRSPSTAAAVFTLNQVTAAPVRLSQENLKLSGGRLQCVVVNSGNANAVTGPAGEIHARQMVDTAALHLGLSPQSICVMSTGIIGVPLPIERVEKGIQEAAQCLEKSGGAHAALAIMTTDQYVKEAAVEVQNGTIFKLQNEEEYTHKGYCVAGMAKGAGMIHPNMATMLAILTTDADLAPEIAQSVLKRVVDRTFNRISVDGDTSTNDTVLLLANGQSKITPHIEEFEKALEDVCLTLSKKIVRDGEGATKVIAVQVKGTASDKDAHSVAQTVATSSLFKTAMYGRDANWGRVLAAAGRSGVEFQLQDVSLFMGCNCLLKEGVPQPLDEAQMISYLSLEEVDVVINLGAGPGQATVWCSDLTHDYVTVNASYRT